MRQPVLIAGLLILGTALVVLLLFGSGGSIAGLNPDSFARAAALSALALLIGSGLVLGRHRVNLRLWHGAAWLAALVLLVWLYRAYEGGF